MNCQLPLATSFATTIAHDRVVSEGPGAHNCQLRNELNSILTWRNSRMPANSPKAGNWTGPTYKTTGINLPSDIWELLNRVAFERAKKYGGRPSVSALLVDLVQRHRKELEKELGG